MTATSGGAIKVENESRIRIDVSAVRRSFVSKRRVFNALGPIDLQVEDGEFVCIVGPSGCGKSTLLRIVGGLIPPTAGHVDLFGDSARESKTAMVFQNYSILPWKSVIENIRFGLDIEGVAREEGNREAQKWVETLGLAGFESSYPATLSGGMQQRVAIARAFAVEPDILLMDEPFAALDAQMRLLLQEVLLGICQNDRRTVVFITHSIEEALLLGDRVVVMSNQPGTIIADIPVSFERPRTAALRGSPEFATMHEEIWTLLRGETVKAG